MGSSGSKKASDKANGREREESAPPVEREGIVSGGGTSGSSGGGGGGGSAEAGVAAAAQDGAPAQQDEASEEFEFVIVEPQRPAAAAVGSAVAAAPAAVVDDAQAESAAAVAVGCAVAVAAAAVVDEEQTEGAGPAAVARVGAATAVDDANADLLAAGRATKRAAQRVAQPTAESAPAAKNAPLIETLLRCSHASAIQGAKGRLVRTLANLVYGPKEFVTIQGVDKALRWYTHIRAAALGLETETKNRRGRRSHAPGTADVVVRKPQGWAMRTLDQVATALATALEAEGPRLSRRSASKARKRAKIDAWRGKCYECGCEVDAYEAAISLSVEGHYCSVCIELPEYENYKWEGAAEGGRLYNDGYNDYYNDNDDDDDDDDDGFGGYYGY